jgi:hypothetical protein
MAAQAVDWYPSLTPVQKRIIGQLFVVVSATLIVGLIFAACIVIVRRGADKFAEAPSSIALIVTGSCAVVAAEGAWWFSRGLLPPPIHRATSAVVLWTTAVALLTLAIGLSVPGSSTFGLSGLWLLIGAEAITIARRLMRNRMPDSIGSHLQRAPVPVVDWRTEPSVKIELSQNADDVVQKLIRTQADGVDRIQGWLKARLAESERNATLHVAFCPPFDEAPTLTVVQTNGPECRIKTGQLLSYGVRLELKRVLAGAEQAVVVIEFSAQAPYRSA